MKFKVEQSRCQGHAQCSLIAPKLFLLDDDGYIAMDGEYEYSAEDRAAVLVAVQSCPEQALEVIDDRA